MAADRLFQQVTITLDVVAFGSNRLITFGSEVPVSFNLQLSIFFQFQNMSGHQLADAGKKSFRTREVAECEIFRKGFPVKLRTNSRAGNDRLNFRPENEGLKSVTIIERLDPQSVSGGEQNSLTAVPDCESKHSP